MLLVVFSHVLLFSFKSDLSFSFNSIFVTFRMPLFFSLSGFFFFKPLRFRRFHDLISFDKKKFVVQIIPTLFFSFIYCEVFDLSFSALWLSSSKYGYWFTIVLFIFFIIYSFLQYCLECLSLVNSRFKAEYAFIIQGLVSCFLFLLSYYSISSICPWKDSSISGILSLEHFKYYVFFILGTFIRWKYDFFRNCFEIIQKIC